MQLHQLIVSARKQKGLTQEELADLAKLTVRTIQRIESGESVPRSFTLKAIAKALDKPFEYFVDNDSTKDVQAAETQATDQQKNDAHFLQMLNLSSFLYLVLPLLHVLLPIYLLRREKGLDQPTINFSRSIIRQQLYWAISMHLLLLLTLGYNFLQASSGNRNFINYLWPFFIMYLLNAILIGLNALRIKKSGSA